MSKSDVLIVYEDDGSGIVHEIPIADDGKPMDWNNIELIG